MERWRSTGALMRRGVSDSPREEATAALAHADVLYHLAFHLTCNRADAEDLVQETYARALRAWGSFAGGTDLRAWLLRILRNTFLDRQRRARNHVEEGGFEDGAPGADGAGDTWLRGDREPEQLRSLVAADVAAALLELPEAARTLILLDLEGLTEAELAVVLGCAAGTVKSRLWRARCRLRERLADYRREG
jgi:RNA polymerase sigma-70 factor (ECF subfamily)